MGQEEEEEEIRLSEEFKRLHDSKNAKHLELVSEILRGQSDQLKERQELRRWFKTRLLIPATTLILGGGSTLGYVRYNKPEDEVSEKLQELEERQALLAREISSSVEYLAEKIECDGSGPAEPKSMLEGPLDFQLP